MSYATAIHRHTGYYHSIELILNTHLENFKSLFPYFSTRVTGSIE